MSSETHANARVESLLRELVAIDSTSARPNAPVIDRIEQLLTPAGFSTKRLRYVDSAGVEKQNLLAHAGPDGEGGLALVGHTDCVPFDPAWTEALTLTEREGKLYARGAADTKGFIACALASVLGADLRALKNPLWLVFTADEEIGCVGAKKLVDAGAVKPAFAIVGEPTRLRPVRAHKGYCVAEIELIGIEGHSAYPELGTSAVRAAGKLLQKLEALDAELRTLTDAAFSPPFTTTNVGLISGGKAKNIIAGSCKLTLEWRPVPGQRPELVAERVRAALEALVQEEPRLRYQLDANRLDVGVATPSDSPLVRFLEQESGNAVTTVSFGTEAPQLTALGASAVVFGPGDIGVAHRTGEFVPREDLSRCESILSKALARFC
jgi:acetylornithine deacetylase